jgi:hypothetical protein
VLLQELLVDLQQHLVPICLWGRKPANAVLKGAKASVNGDAVVPYVFHHVPPIELVDSILTGHIIRR